MMPDGQRKHLTIVGGGKVGRTLGRLFAVNGLFRIQHIKNRSLESAQDTAAFVGAGMAVSSWSDMTPSDIVMLAVPDDQIQVSCGQLMQHGLIQADTVLFHCSGSHSSSILAAAAREGAATASMHPVRSFADPSQVAGTFAGTFCSIEGESRALAVLGPAMSRLGAYAVPIQVEAKTLYHAASVFACNYLVTLLDLAQQAYEASGIPEKEAQGMMQSLVRETIENLFRMGAERALTGPIARGDWETVERQQEVVDGWSTQAGKVYQAMAQATAQLAHRKGQGSMAEKRTENEV